MVNGETNGNRIGAILGIPHRSVKRYVVQIKQGWREIESEEIESLRQEAIQRKQNVFLQAMNGHKQSKQAEVPCDSCKGTGKKGEETCTVCDGMAVRVVKKPGDPAFLRVALEADRDVCRLRGLLERDVTVIQPTQVNVNVSDGAIDWDKIPLEELKEYRKMHKKLVQLSRKGLTVDVESKET